MTRFAAVDCGTNSIRLLISEVSVDPAADAAGAAAWGTKDILREMTIVRLGEGVDASGEFAPAALERTKEALARYVDLMREHRVRFVRMVATSATRDAANREEFFAMTASLLGQITPGARAEVISGEEEAHLSFTGAVADLPAGDEPFLVIDLGGGSTEFIVGTRAGEILGAHSAHMGCVRLSERILRADPPTTTEIDIARDLVAQRMQEVATIVPLGQAATVVGCAGTFTTLSALAQGLETYDEDAIHGSELNLEPLRHLTEQLLHQTAAQRAQNPVIHPGRADVLGGGCIVVQGIIDTLESVGIRSIRISEKDILDGIIAGLAATHLGDADAAGEHPHG
ncbi:exopolyphosphatase [Corynebacterium sp. 13CS0277]|uniref:Ppx/GppA phosphatase family protein n=1 Tax=Corynebacterium sp. 13CS0277 TaxID=2071994 RepID=UPI000D0286FE|nr:Ppx/GppA phosphatase family protein [Corynebacterium sp. 13CS0277]PRQ12401.1 exopolyphosphatase [Corynebacterium sp. 13CS0277]